MTKIITAIVTIIGLVAAIIGIWTYCKTACNRVGGDIQILIDEPVFWREYPATIEVNITEGKSNIDYYKVVVFQRNTIEDPKQENYMFEKLLTSTSDKLKSFIWYGSASKGNKEDFIVTALVVEKDLTFQKHPIVYSLKDIKYQIIGQKTVKRDDQKAKK